MDEDLEQMKREELIEAVKSRSYGAGSVSTAIVAGMNYVGTILYSGGYCRTKPTLFLECPSGRNS